MNKQGSTLLEQAMRLQQEGELAKSEAILLYLTRKFPNEADYYYQLGNLFFHSSNLKKAQKAFQAALQINPNHTDASIALSVLYNDVGHYGAAKKVYQAAKGKVELSPSEHLMGDTHLKRKFALKHLELAEMYLLYEQLDDAMREYLKVLTLDATLVEARIKLAKVYVQKGMMSKGLYELKKAKNDFPDSDEVRMALGILHFSQGRVIEAQTEWEKILERNPHSSEARVYLNISQTAGETTLNELF